MVAVTDFQASAIMEIVTNVPIAKWSDMSQESNQAEELQKYTKKLPAAKYLNEVSKNLNEAKIAQECTTLYMSLKRESPMLLSCSVKLVCLRGPRRNEFHLSSS